MASFEKYNDEEINQPFLLNESNHNRNSERNSASCTCSQNTRRQRKNTKQSNILLWSIICHVLLIILFISSFFAVKVYFEKTNYGTESLEPQVQQSFSPVGPLEYESKLLGSPFKNNPFVGEPGAEVDKAWGDLLRNAQIKVSAEELSQTPQKTSIPLADGSGYIAELGVYHYLHCLKMIKQNLHLDYYHPEYNEYESTRQRFHIDHCIEFLREALMCNADTSIMTFRWVPEFPIPVTDLWSRHQCVRWDMVENWADERRVNLSEPGVIVGKGE